MPNNSTSNLADTATDIENWMNQNLEMIGIGVACAAAFILITACIAIYCIRCCRSHPDARPKRANQQVNNRALATPLLIGRHSANGSGSHKIQMADVASPQESSTTASPL